MTCQSDLARQAAATKAVNPDAKVFVYRNIVKALPWFDQVREKLEDPQYWGWFLPYNESIRATNPNTAGPLSLPLCFSLFFAHFCCCNRSWPLLPWFFLS